MAIAAAHNPISRMQQTSGTKNVTRWRLNRTIASRRSATRRAKPAHKCTRFAHFSQAGSPQAWYAQLSVLMTSIPTMKKPRPNKPTWTTNSNIVTTTSAVAPRRGGVDRCCVGPRSPAGAFAGLATRQAYPDSNSAAWIAPPHHAEASRPQSVGALDCRSAGLEFSQAPGVAAVLGPLGQRRAIR
jgi:hypothetical protein